MSDLNTPAAHADFTFGAPVHVATALPGFDAVHDVVSSFSWDGLEIYLSSTRPGGHGQAGDVWVLRRDSLAADWVGPEPLGPVVNDPCGASAACISADSLELYFMSNRPAGRGDWDLYVSRRPTRNDPWGQAVNLGPAVNSAALDASPTISPNGLELYFTSTRPGGLGGFDLYVAKRATTKEAWGTPENVGPAVNSIHDDAGPSLLPNGLVLLFQDGASVRPEGYGLGDLWMTRRASLSEPWGPLVNLGPTINSPQSEGAAHVSSPDGSTLYFVREAAGWARLQAPIIPTVDLNADGAVDLGDVRALVDHWGTRDSRYDIGPTPVGDGIVDARDLLVLTKHIAAGDGNVDIEDLKVFMTYYEKENPPAQP